MSYVPGMPDRIATLEEVCEAMDLLGRLTIDQGLAYSPVLAFSLPLAVTGATANPRCLWIDISEEEAVVEALQASSESLTELLADRCDLAN